METGEIWDCGFRNADLKDEEDDALRPHDLGPWWPRSCGRYNSPMDIRFSAAKLAAKLVGTASRALRAGGGTSLPGKVALHVDPHLLKKLAARLSEGVILITGTNGKTTTARMLAGVLRAQGHSVVHNREGANLRSGLATALLSSEGDVGLLEVDEATIPLVAGDLAPKAIVVTNIFRDQLDRYGELDRTAELIGSAITAAGPATTAVLNADDPRVAALATGASARVIHFGLDHTDAGHYGSQRDSRDCRVCGTALDYQLYFYAHLGHYSCPACGASRPTPAITAADISSESGEMLFQLSTEDSHTKIKLPVPGLYNVYNALAAAGAALALGIPATEAATALEKYRPAFGRMERVDVGGCQILMALVKNPTGFDQVIEAITANESTHSAVIAINDELADGTDVSWLWDVNIERLADLPLLVASGIRGADMAVRLKYAGADLNGIIVERELRRAIERAISGVETEGAVAVICTYTALFEARRALTRLADLKEFWRHEAI